LYSMRYSKKVWNLLKIAYESSVLSTQTEPIPRLSNTAFVP
jgi:hypothetical protein